MDKKLVEKMTKEELIELVRRQDQAINSLDQQRFDSNAVIEHLVTATENMRNLRYHDIERDHDQEYLNDYIREMYRKYPEYIVSAEYPEKNKSAITECEKEPKRLIWHPYPNEKPTVNGDYDVSLRSYNFVVRAYYDVGRDEWTNTEDFECIETVIAWTDLLEGEEDADKL